MSLLDEFAQLRLKSNDPIKHDYEVIRLGVLFSETLTEHSRQIGIERTVVGDKAKALFNKGC